MKKKGRRAKERGEFRWRQTLLWAGLLVFAAVVLVYANTLGHALVFDDVTLILQNPQVKNQEWLQMVGRGGYRPVRTLTYAVNYRLGGEDPFGYHLFNVLLHGANALLVLLVAWTWSRSRILSVVAALAFALHPAQTAAVAYVSGRKDLLAAFFVLLGCYFYSRYRQTKGKGYPAAALVCFCLGVLSKEVSIVFPALLLMVGALEWFQRGTREVGDRGTPIWGALLAELRRSYLLFGGLAALGLLAGYYALFITEASRMEGYWGGSWETNLGTSFKLFVHYLKLAVVPYPLIADYKGEVLSLSAGLLEPATLGAVGVVVGYLALALWLFPRQPLMSVGMLWFLTALLPVLQLVPFHELAADHFLYLPLVGAALAAGAGFDRLTRVKQKGAVAWGVAAAVLAIWAGMTVQRNRDWKDEETLWQATLRKAPRSYRAYTNLGTIYRQKGDFPKALEYTRKVTELNPGEALPWSNLGGMYHELAEATRRAGRIHEALALQRESIQYLERSVKLNPRDPFALSNLADAYKGLGTVFALQGEGEKAAEARVQALQTFQKAMQTPTQHEFFPLIWYKAGLLFVEMKEYETALQHFCVATDAFPNHPGGHYWKGYCYFELGEYQKAVPHLQKASRREPTMENLGLLARSHENLGDFGGAIEVYRKAATEFPEAVEPHYNLGVLFHRVGDDARSREHLKQALQLAPEGPLAPNIRQMLQVLLHLGSVER